MIGLALWAPLRWAFGACLIVAFVTDVFDGIIARRLKVATARLRRLDSVADSLFYFAAVFAVWHLHPQVLLRHAGLLGVLATLEAGRYAFDYLKFGREASYHMWSSKLWGLLLFAAFLTMLALPFSDGVLLAAIIGGIVADLEGLLISLLLPYWQHDVPTLFHALRLRRAGADGE